MTKFNRILAAAFSVALFPALGSTTLQALPKDRQKPSVAITSPVTGAVVSETIVVLGTSADNRGLAKVEVKVDGGAYVAAGWGMAFLEPRKTVGATNATLAMDISGWATGKDLFYFSVTDSLGPEVDKAYAFLAPLGLAPNQTGQTWDLLANNPLDRDSDYYTTLGQNRWWDASDTASINSKRFNRFAEWLRLWNVKASKRWVLWQIPLGNSNHLNVHNNGSARQGYKDNRPEYFFGSGSAAHRDAFVNAGVIGLFFGPGASILGAAAASRRCTQKRRGSRSVSQSANLPSGRLREREQNATKGFLLQSGAVV